MQVIFPARGQPACWTVLSIFSLACIYCAAAAHAQNLEIRYNLLELPSARQAQVDFSKPVFATVDQQPLGRCLVELARTYQVSLWLDRRVDRSRIVSYDGQSHKPAGDDSALARLRAIAKLGEADAGLIENVLYVGPADQVAAVQYAAIRLHDEISQTARTAQLQALAWEELTTPTELLAQIQSQWQVSCVAELPHDLMHAGQLPTSTLATQLTLLCAGFELQAHRATEGNMVLEALDQTTVWQANYLRKDVQTQQFVNARRDFPGATATIQNGLAVITGPTDFHLRLLTPNRPTPRETKELKFSIPKINAPLAKILGDMSKQLGMQLEWDRRITESQKDSLLTFGVPEPRSLAEVLKILSSTSGLVIERREQTILVGPDEP